MNQQPPNGNSSVPYPPNNQQPVNQSQPMGTQPYGQQWNAAPNFTAPLPGNQPMPPAQNKNAKKSKKSGSKKKGNGSIIGYIFLGIFLMIAIAVAGGFLGYNTAINARKAEYTRRSMMAAAEQYQMAIADIEQGKYQNAKTRLDYVIEVDPEYPGAMMTYQQVILALFPTASPTPLITATPAPTATIDTRGEEEMFQAIQMAIYNQNWENAINMIVALRDRNINFRGLEVDGLYYIALRNYGIQQINAGYLENGVYNITLAEALGPIDNQANSMRDAARSYLAGAGFWEINWNKALEYYSNAAQVMPNLMDRATGLTANQRFAEASFRVGDEYVAREDYCGAIPFYEQGMPIAGTESMQMTATAVYFECYPPTEEPVYTDNPVITDGSENSVISDDGIIPYEELPMPVY